MFMVQGSRCRVESFGLGYLVLIYGIQDSKVGDQDLGSRSGYKV
jgi:hypothetical protein